ncbi:hypothetical protein QJQ45_001189 [Haematococcus lacustris]|nr:hypothetical protein QJQ45_001189 [Haematococcus lacustris]
MAGGEAAFRCLPLHEAEQRPGPKDLALYAKALQAGGTTQGRGCCTGGGRQQEAGCMQRWRVSWLWGELSGARNVRPGFRGGPCRPGPGAAAGQGLVDAAPQVVGEYLHPKWAEQKMRLHGAQEMVLERYFKKLEEEAASVSQQQWGARKQLVVFFGNAGIGTRACRKVVERSNSGKPTDRVPGWVVTVDEFRISRVSSILNSPQPCEEELDSSKPTRPDDWKPMPGQVQNPLSRPPPGDLGKWVDRDCNVALNLQRAGESNWRPFELCRWPYRGRLPAQGKEYPALGFKKLRDRAPKAQAQQPVAR